MTALPTRFTRYLSQPSHIAFQALRYSGSNAPGEFEIFEVGSQRQSLENVAEVLLEFEVNHFQFELARFDFGEIQDVVDQRQKRVRGSLHHSQVVSLFGVQFVSRA